MGAAHVLRQRIVDCATAVADIAISHPRNLLRIPATSSNTLGSDAVDSQRGSHLLRRDAESQPRALGERPTHNPSRTLPLTIEHHNVFHSCHPFVQEGDRPRKQPTPGAPVSSKRQKRVISHITPGKSLGTPPTFADTLGSTDFNSQRRSHLLCRERYLCYIRLSEWTPCWTRRRSLGSLVNADRQSHATSSNLYTPPYNARVVDARNLCSSRSATPVAYPSAERSGS